MAHTFPDNIKGKTWLVILKGAKKSCCIWGMPALPEFVGTDDT